MVQVDLEFQRKPNELLSEYEMRIWEAKYDKDIELDWSEIMELLGHTGYIDDYRKSARLRVDYFRKMLAEAGMTASEFWQTLIKNNAVHNFPEMIDISNKEAISKNADGTFTSEKIIPANKDELMDDIYLLKQHGYDPAVWKVKSSKHSWWNVQKKGGEEKTFYASKLTVEKKQAEWSVEDVDAYFETKQFKNAKELTVPTNYDSDGEILEIDLPDLHAGLYAWRHEATEDYDIHIMRSNFLKCFNDIIERCNGRKFKKIIFATLGDLLHADNDNQTTAKGIFQQIDGRIAKVFDITLDMLIDAVELLGNYAPTQVVYVAGNHDRTLGYTLIKALEKALLDMYLNEMEPVQKGIFRAFEKGGWGVKEQ